jgi:hypothetical protein
MRPEERTEGDYRIVAKALYGPSRRGYVASVLVQRVRGGTNTPRVAYRDENLAGGHAWPTAQAARLYALAKAQDVIRHEAFRLSC